MLKSSMFKPVHALLFGAVALVVAGCGAGGPSFNPVGGKLTVDGKVPANVQVSFYPVDGKGPIASGNVDAGTGRYDLTSSGGVGKPAGKGAVAGKDKVVLNAGGGAGARGAVSLNKSNSCGGRRRCGSSTPARRPIGGPRTRSRW